MAFAGMAVSGMLAVAKIVAGLAGNSSATVADGLESAGDVFASGFVWLGLTVAARPADANHPYGHGRAETLTGLVIGLALTVVGTLIAYRSLEGIASARAAPSLYVLWPLIASAVAKAGLSGLKFHYGRKLKSSALIADAWNDTVDILSAVSALIAVGLALHSPRFVVADRIGASVVGLIVIFTGLRVAYDTAMQLMDTMPDERSMVAIRRAALEVPGALGVEKCFARRTGTQYHVDLHLEVDPAMTVRASHELATVVRARVKAELDWVADVLVHVEPAGRDVARP